jgi:hypothetical protein
MLSPDKRVGTGCTGQGETHHAFIRVRLMR